MLRDVWVRRVRRRYLRVLEGMDLTKDGFFSYTYPLVRSRPPFSLRCRAIRLVPSPRCVPAYASDPSSPPPQTETLQRNVLATSDGAPAASCPSPFLSQFCWSSYLASPFIEAFGAAAACSSPFAQTASPSAPRALSCPASTVFAPHRLTHPHAPAPPAPPPRQAAARRATPPPAAGSSR